METMLTVMGVISIAVLAWFVVGWLRAIVQALRKPKGRATDSVGKDMY